MIQMLRKSTHEVLFKLEQSDHDTTEITLKLVFLGNIYHFIDVLRLELVSRDRIDDHARINTQLAGSIVKEFHAIVQLTRIEQTLDGV